MMAVAWRAAAAPDKVRPIWKAMIVGGLLFLPAALGYFILDLSFTIGTALVCLGALALAAAGKVPLTTREVQISLLGSGLAAALILVHLLVANVINNDPRFDVGRAVQSLFMLGVVLLAAPVVSRAVMKADDGTAVVLRAVILIFVLSGTLAALEIQPPSPTLGQKPTFPFTEPSFLGFTFPAALIYSLARSSLYVRAALIFIFLVIGYSLGNLTIVVTCLFAATVTLPLLWIGAGAASLVTAAASLDLSYYTERLDLDWANSINLSSLVYTQGWQMLEESLRNTYGWGVGFQQLGIVYTNVPASYRINIIAGRDSNLQDGGFILAKLGSELGIFGLAFIAVYLIIAARSFLKVRAAALGRQALSDGETFARACVIGYSVETFVRGGSYFTGTFVLLLAALLFLYGNRQATADAIIARA
jgi:hypothetical protein